LSARMTRYESTESPFMNMNWETQDFYLSKFYDDVARDDDKTSSNEPLKAFFAESLKIEEKEASLFKHGMLRITESNSGRILLDEELARSDIYFTAISDEPRMFIVGIWGKDLMTRVTVLHYDCETWNVYEQLEFSEYFSIRTDIDNKAVILQDAKHSILLVAE